MTAIWTTQISEAKWRRVRRELEDNGLILPFSGGVSHNRKTGYILTNNYDRETSTLRIQVTYPGEISIIPVCILLSGLFESFGEGKRTDDNSVLSVSL